MKIRFFDYFEAAKRIPGKNFLLKHYPMKKSYAILFSLFTLSVFAQQTNQTMDVNGVTRSYVRYFPAGFNPSTESLPVVFCLHGLGDVASNIATIGFNQIGDTARFIAVYPQGLTNNFSQTSWSNGTAFLSSSADDITFFNQLIDDMILNHNANPARIYMTGFSMGGIMSHKLACELNSRVAAIGTMSGTISTPVMNSCNPSYATPIMHVHGTADGTVPYSGTALPTLELVDPTINFWRNVHGCASTADTFAIPDAASDGFTVDRIVYQGCSPNGSVELWRVNGGDHQYFYQPVNDFTEAIELWLFLRQWEHSAPATAGLTSLQPEEITVYPNPAGEELNISATEAHQVALYSIFGQEIAGFELQPGITTWPTSSLAPGVYFLRVDGNPHSAQRVVIQ